MARCNAASIALAEVCRYHGIAIRCADVPRAVGLSSIAQLRDVIVAARMLGFDGVPLEGEYDELPEVPRPNIVALRDGGFDVLHEIDAMRARLASGELSRNEFIARWTGDCIQMTPEGLTAALERIARVRRISPRARMFIAFAVGLAALGAWGVAAGTWMTVPLAVASGAGAWLVAFRRGCASCARAHELSGNLPLGAIGAVGYAALIPFAIYARDLAALALFAATGAHAGLVAILARARAPCMPCVIAAAAAWTAAAAVGAGIALPIATVTAVLAYVAVPGMQTRARALGIAHAEQLARERLAAGPPGVRVTVWKRAGCAACIVFDSVWKPALAQDFDESLELEEHALRYGSAPTPLVLVTGPSPVLFIGFGAAENDYDRLRAAVEVSLRSDRRELELVTTAAAPAASPWRRRLRHQ